MIKFIFKLSRWQHKVIGLFLMLYLMLMSITGILLNHPGAIRAISLPLSWMPSNYLYQNWNRGLINDAVLNDDGNRLLLAGKEGVWQAHNAPGGIRFEALDAGYPTAAYDKTTSSVVEVQDAEGQDWLLAAARSDVLVFSPETQRWESTSFPGNTGNIKKLLYHNHTVYAITEKGIYTCRQPLIETTSWDYLPVELKGEFDDIPLFRFLFKLHDGSLFGFVGKLLFDVAALAIIYLCVSGIKMWFFPKRFKRLPHKPTDRMKQSYVTATRRHLKIGLYAAPLLLVFALTGLFMRPPLLIAIVRKTVPAKWMYPLSTVPSMPALESAAIDTSNNRLFLLTRQGLFEGPLDAEGPFESNDIRLPIHGMGATVFQHLGGDEVLVGSFSGLFRCNTKTGRIVNYPDNTRPSRGGHGHPGTSVMALSVERSSNLFCVGYYKGLLLADHVPHDSWLRQLKMPEMMNHRAAISLWHCLFEIHNGRYFRALVGVWFILIVPLGALAFATIILTGCYDWLYRKKLSKKRRP